MITRHRAGPLHVCLISEEFPPETGFGGIGTYAYVLARTLARLGHRVQVIARTWESEKTDNLDGVRLHRVSVPEPSWRRGTRSLSVRFHDAREILLWNVRVARLVARISRSDPFDVIESPEYRAQGLLTTFRGISAALVVKLHTPSFLCRVLDEGVAGRASVDVALSEHLEYRLARRASMLTSPSRTLADDVARHWRLDPTRIRVLPNPIDTGLFGPSDAFVAEDPTVLFVGRIERRKGVGTLIEATPMILRRVPRARVQLVGSDHPSGPSGVSMTAHLKQRLRDLGVPDSTARFVGAVERSMLPAWYGSASVVVIPSRYENFPYTCLEAMACGRPVVASDVGGIPEIITHGVDGILVPPERPEELAIAVVELLANPRRRHELGQRARKTVLERFSEAAVCGVTVDAYRSALAG
jgi:glycogen(starch) synthase